MSTNPFISVSSDFDSLRTRETSEAASLELWGFGSSGSSKLVLSVLDRFLLLGVSEDNGNIVLASFIRSSCVVSGLYKLIARFVFAASRTWLVIPTNET